MLGLIKFTGIPSLAVWQLLGAAQLPGAGTISALIAIAVVLGGVFMFGTMKTRADEAERLLRLAREEADIEREKSARLEKENTVLRAQPNLEKHQKLLETLIDRADAQTRLLVEIHTATLAA